MLCRLHTSIKNVAIHSFADASFKIVTGREYGLMGIITGLMIQGHDGEDVCQVIDWSSSKQRRVTHSSYGAEIIACADADDRDSGLKQILGSLHRTETVRPILHVYSRGLFHTIIKLLDGREYRLRQTVQPIRDSFEAGDIDGLRCVPSSCSIADAQAKG